MVDPTISNFEQEYTDMKINIDIEQEEEIQSIQAV